MMDLRHVSPPDHRATSVQEINCDGGSATVSEESVLVLSLVEATNAELVVFYVVRRPG
jgi:hypothetical protein